MSLDTTAEINDRQRERCRSEHRWSYRSVGPDITLSNQQYDHLAPVYDINTPRLDALRAQVIVHLQLSAGMTVLDIGCGTGKAFAQLSRTVGPGGRVIAVEPSAAMALIAQQRITDLSLSNVTLIHSDILHAYLEGVVADAVLLMFTHDVLRCELSLQKIIEHTRLGTRFALSGGKFFSGALAVLNPWVRWRQRPYCTTFEGYDKPWSKLAPMLSQLRAQSKFAGIAYLAWGER
jgi:ubiquinone/menaquinone biosynthesis C-methylase UbiE